MTLKNMVAATAIVVVAVASTASAQDNGVLVVNSFGGNWGKAIQLGLIDFVPERDRYQGAVALHPGRRQKQGRASASGNAPPEDLIDTNFATGYSLSRDGLLADIDYSKFSKETVETLPEYREAALCLRVGPVRRRHLLRQGAVRQGQGAQDLGRFLERSRFSRQARRAGLARRTDPGDRAVRRRYGGRQAVSARPRRRLCQA